MHALVDLAALVILHRRDNEALVEDRARQRARRGWHDAADVRLVPHARAERQQATIDEHRRRDSDVRRVRDAALVRVVGEKRVAGKDAVDSVVGEDPLDHPRVGNRVERHARRADQPAVAGRQPGAAVERFAQDRRISGPKQPLLDDLLDFVEPACDDFEGDGVEFHGVPYRALMMMFACASTRAVCPASRTVVESGWSMIAGPWISCPAFSVARS